MWACTDPSCTEIQDGKSETRRVGRMYSEPVGRCLCGSRVLELLYCQNCGDVFLGGYVPAGSTQQPGKAVTLLADLSDIQHLPDHVGLERTANNYLLYWPQKRKPDLEALEWNADKNKVKYAFLRSILRPETGELRPTSGDGHTGWTFRVTTPAGKRNAEQLSPFPTRCPNCSDDWEIRHTAEGPVRSDDKNAKDHPFAQCALVSKKSIRY